MLSLSPACISSWLNLQYKAVILSVCNILSSFPTTDKHGICTVYIIPHTAASVSYTHLSMTDILIKAASFTCIILAGYLLRRKGFFKEEDFYVLSKIVLDVYKRQGYEIHMGQTVINREEGIIDTVKIVDGIPEICRPTAYLMAVSYTHLNLLWR